MGHGVRRQKTDILSWEWLLAAINSMDNGPTDNGQDSPFLRVVQLCLVFS